VHPGPSCHSAMRIRDIIRGTRGVTADTAMRLARYFGTTPEFWLNLQAGWESGVTLLHVAFTFDE